MSLGCLMVQNSCRSSGHHSCIMGRKRRGWVVQKWMTLNWEFSQKHSFSAYVSLATSSSPGDFGKCVFLTRCIAAFNHTWALWVRKKRKMSMVRRTRHLWSYKEALVHECCAQFVEEETETRAYSSAQGPSECGTEAGFEPRAAVRFGVPMCCTVLFPLSFYSRTCTPCSAHIILLIIMRALHLGYHYPHFTDGSQRGLVSRPEPHGATKPLILTLELFVTLSL